VHRHPDESVQAEDEVDAARQSVEVGFQARKKGGGKSDEMTVLELRWKEEDETSWFSERTRRSRDATGEKWTNLSVSQRTGM